MKKKELFSLESQKIRKQHSSTRSMDLSRLNLAFTRLFGSGSMNRGVGAASRIREGGNAMVCPEAESMIARTWLKGRLQYRTSSEGACEAVGYYENGSLRFRYPVRDGEIHGVGKTSYEDGVLECEESYWNGVLHGPAYHWYPNGVMKSEEHYRKGLWHGTQKRWFSSGVLAFQRAYSEGQRNGPSIRWYPKGKLLSRMNFVDDQPHGIREEYAEDGSLVAKEIYVRGVKMPLKKYEQFLAGQLPAKDILEIKNSAVRRILVEEFGYARILAEMSHEVIERDGEQELVRIVWRLREEPICLVKVKCPSTGAFYTLRVPPTMKTVKNAVAWTFDVKADEYEPAKET